MLAVTRANRIQLYGSHMQMNAVIHCDISSPNFSLSSTDSLPLVHTQNYVDAFHFENMNAKSKLAKSNINDKCNKRTIQSGNEMSKDTIRIIRLDEFYFVPTFLTDLSNPLFMSSRGLFSNPTKRFLSWVAIPQLLCSEDHLRTI